MLEFYERTTLKPLNKTHRGIHIWMLLLGVHNSCRCSPKCGNIYDFDVSSLSHFLSLLGRSVGEQRIFFFLFLKTPWYAKWLKPIGWRLASIETILSTPVHFDSLVVRLTILVRFHSSCQHQISSKKQQTWTEKKWEFICGHIICCFMTKQNSTIRHMYNSTAFQLFDIFHGRFCDTTCSVFFSF